MPTKTTPQKRFFPPALCNSKETKNHFKFFNMLGTVYLLHSSISLSVLLLHFKWKTIFIIIIIKIIIILLFSSSTSNDSRDYFDD